MIYGFSYSRVLLSRLVNNVSSFSEFVIIANYFGLFQCWYRFRCISLEVWLCCWFANKEIRIIRWHFQLLEFLLVYFAFFEHDFQLYVMCLFIWFVSPASDAVELSLRGWLIFSVRGLRPYRSTTTTGVLSKEVLENFSYILDAIFFVFNAVN